MRDKRGTAMIESAIALPLVIFLMIATIFLGLYVHAQTAANSAARAGAREYGVNGDYERAMNRAENILSASGLPSGQREIVIEEQGDTVEVFVYYSQVFPASGILGGSGHFNVRGYALYRRETP